MIARNEQNAVIVAASVLLAGHGADAGPDDINRAVAMAAAIAVASRRHLPPKDRKEVTR